MIDVEAIRRDFPALDRGISFDNGTVSLTPRPVAEALERDLRSVLQTGPPHVISAEDEFERRETTRRAIARFLGTTNDCLALTRGVSEAFHIVLDSLEWLPGDEVVLSEDEHAALLLPALHLSRTRAVKIRELSFDEISRHGVDAALGSVIGPRTKLIALSHVTSGNGIRYPVEAICRIARSRGILTFLDIAHSAGIVPFALDTLDCDLAGIVSYKWMYAPYAAGALFVKPTAIDRLTLRFAGGRSEQWLDAPSKTYALRSDARRFEYGPWAWAFVHAWAAATHYLEGCGRSAVWERTQQHVSTLRAGLESVDGMEVLTPGAEHSAALLTVKVHDLSAEAIRDMLLEQGIRIKAFPDGNRLRASIGMFTSERDIAILVGALKTICRRRVAKG